MFQGRLILVPLMYDRYADVHAHGSSYMLYMDDILYMLDDILYMLVAIFDHYNQSSYRFTSQ